MFRIFCLVFFLWCSLLPPDAIAQRRKKSILSGAAADSVAAEEVEAKPQRSKADIFDKPVGKNAPAAATKAMPKRKSGGKKSDGELEAGELPEPEIVTITSKLPGTDGINLSCTLFMSANSENPDESKTISPMSLVHDFGGSKQDLAPLARHLQSAGHTVLVPDLRGHGRSTTIANEIETVDYAKFRKSDFATIGEDLEACKRFLIQYNNEGKLNISMLSVLAGGDMCPIATGDGGSANDPQNNSQTITNNLLGKILRVDVDSDDFPEDASRNYSIPASNPFVGQMGDDEIFAYGLRNPYRSSFDSATGDLWIGDVGQNALEEIDIILAGTSGQNFGWRTREGTLGASVPGAIDPVYQYSHGGGDTQGFSVTGGYVYRGSISELDGLYFFSDFVTDRLWSFKFNGDGQANFDATNFTDFTDWSAKVEVSPGPGNLGSATIRNVSSFGEDPAGNLIVVSLDGNIFRLNSVNRLGDVNLDGVINFSDIPAFISVLSDGTFQAEADTDRNANVNFSDIGPFIDILIGQ